MMATGPEHYKMAEKILNHVTTDANVKPETRNSMIAAAQVHATLALVAARVPLPRDHRAWAEAFNGEPG